MLEGATQQPLAVQPGIRISFVTPKLSPRTPSKTYTGCRNICRALRIKTRAPASSSSAFLISSSAAVFCAASSVCFLTRCSSSINLQAVALIPSPMPLVPSCGQVSSLAIRRARRASSYSCLHLSALCLSNSLCLALCNAKTHGREESVLKNACDVSIT